MSTSYQAALKALGKSAPTYTVWITCSGCQTLDTQFDLTKREAFANGWKFDNNGCWLCQECGQ